jgi:predicted nucleic acid-binding protein
MPASERLFSAPVPRRLYVNTDVLIAHLVSSDTNHPRCRVFMERLAEDGHVTLVLSTLSWIECTHVVSRQNFCDRLPADFRQQFRLEQWDQPLVRQVYLQMLGGLFEALLAQYDIVEVPVTGEARALAVQYVAQYGLRGQDAVHLASAIQEGVLDMASLDATYRRVEGLVLWNDLVHTRT